MCRLPDSKLGETIMDQNAEELDPGGWTGIVT